MRTSTSTIAIDAPAERVWSALTDPEQVKLWQYGSELVTTWKPGDPIRFQTPWGDQVMQQWGEVVEFTPFEVLKYSLFAPRPGLEDRPENYFFMTYRLETVDGKTKLSIIQEDPRPQADLEEDGEEADDGGESENPVLLGLKKLVEDG